jgi:ribonuclease D
VQSLILKLPLLFLIIHCKSPIKALPNLLKDVRLEKKFTRFDWKKRPLPADVLQYALDDVKYLIPIFNKLSKELIEHGKLEWAEGRLSIFIKKRNLQSQSQTNYKKNKRYFENL